METVLRCKERDEKCQREKRVRCKENIKDLIAAHPDAHNFLKIRSRPGRPRLEEDQPELLKAICDIAIHRSAAHEKRQTEIYRFIKTLDELTI